MRALNKNTVWGYLFASPWIVGFLLFGLYPILVSFWYSLCQYDVLRIPQYIGLRNYRELLFEDHYFYTAVWNTLFYTLVRTPLVIVGSLLLAMLVSKAVRGVRLFRTIYFIPSIISGVILSVLWMWLLNPEYGLVNSTLQFFGLQGPLWLIDPRWSKPAIILMSVWSLGGGRMLVFLAAIQNVPKHFYEAVEMDGGGWWARFRHVTLPFISPVLFLWFIFEIIGSLQVFVEAYVMTKGGPLNSTLFYNLYLYNKAFDDFDMGYASALAWLLFILAGIITLIQFRVSRKWVYYSGGVGK
ncbi:MAG TPA: sugar ABC transporter permease [bacterium]|nr:sugar ABC transporter permease [bacterium]HOC25938.1 sugar ABC transporter permease [bacterium]HOH07509.1 sugar ABC transporter permease [bacterium]HOY45016.1 sugar ABC transporter permease [bacterium]HPG84767.1 sugar ABC transporter permease [bacterium]